ncbi:hypothetical protein RRG08_045565 [Elysia crispata]|uniref:Uncharacterized protein n=1 Tax=Elysia crispata TaxID=231223 RepID=A0AAE1DWA6_9GAST|nr:hypothetical protein RRG08_045565 [Elysia crispata]
MDNKKPRVVIIASRGVLMLLEDSWSSLKNNTCLFMFQEANLPYGKPMLSGRYKQRGDRTKHSWMQNGESNTQIAAVTHFVFLQENLKSLYLSLLENFSEVPVRILVISLLHHSQYAAL